MMDTPPTIARGRSRPGFFISPAIAPTLVQPSNANRTAISVWPSTAPVLSCAPGGGVVTDHGGEYGVSAFAEYEAEDHQQYQRDKLADGGNYLHTGERS